MRHYIAGSCAGRDPGGRALTGAQRHVGARDFMVGALDDGRRFRVLTALDEGNREGLEMAACMSTDTATRSLFAATPVTSTGTPIRAIRHPDAARNATAFGTEGGFVSYARDLTEPESLTVPLRIQAGGYWSPRCLCCHRMVALTAWLGDGLALADSPDVSRVATTRPKRAT